MPANSKILVVDDRAIMRKTIIRILQSAGYNLQEACSGEEALKIVRQFHPDLVLLDVDMPGLSGMEVCLEMKKDPILKAIFVVHLSASRISSEDQTKGLEDGADGYIGWPVKNEELLARVQAMLRIKHAEKALAEQQKWFRTTLASIGDGVIATDGQGKVTFLNPVAQRLTGWTQEDAVSLPIKDVFRMVHRQTGQPTELLSAQILQAGSGVDLVGQTFDQTSLLTKDGQQRPISGSAAPICEENNQLLGVVFVFRDISEQVRQESERERLIGELQEALANVKTLSGLLPICASCKKIRDDKGYWNQIESYVAKHSQATFTHGICPECTKKYFPGIPMD